MGTFLRIRRRAAVKLYAWVAAVGLCGSLSAVEVTPELLTFRAMSGRRSKGQVEIRNDAPEAVTARVEAIPEDGAAWLKVTRRRLRLRPGEKRNVGVVARAIPGAEGERTARIVVTVPGPRDSEIRIVRRARLTVTGTERCKIELGPVSARPGGGTASLTVPCRNEGNMAVHLKTVAELDFGNGEKIRSPAHDAGRLEPGHETRVGVAASTGGRLWTGRGRIFVFYRDENGKTKSTTQEFSSEALTR